MLTSEKRVEFAICLANKGYDDLEVWKVYQVLPDAKAAGVGCIRVIDESGEDYLYPADRFAPVDFPKGVRARLPKWQPDNGNKGRNRPRARPATTGETEADIQQAYRITNNSADPSTAARS